MLRNMRDAISFGGRKSIGNCRVGRRAADGMRREYLFIYLFQFNSRHKAHEKKEKYKKKYRIN